MLKRYLDQAQAAGEIRPDVSTTDAAHLIFSSMMGASVLYSMDRSRGELNRNIDSIIHYIDTKRAGKKEVAV